MHKEPGGGSRGMGREEGEKSEWRAEREGGRAQGMERGDKGEEGVGNEEERREEGGAKREGRRARGP